MADGRVLTGFSLPYIALYTVSTAGVVSYSSGQVLARGVSVDLEVEAAGDDNIFYANNVAAESVSGVFSGGTATLTVDGLKAAAERLLLGLPAAGEDGFTEYGDSASIPYVGLGFVCRYMSGGETSYVPVILNKCRCQMPNLSANTQEEEIDWQTQELVFNVLRDDSANHTWKQVGGEQSTEAAAEAKIKTVFSIT